MKDKTIEELGKAIERFGQALQNPDSKLTDLATLAHLCGMKITFRMENESDSEISDYGTNKVDFDV